MASVQKGSGAKLVISPAIPPPPPQIRNGASKAANSSATSFLDLPAELRNSIYAHALVLSSGPLLISTAHPYRHIADHDESNLLTHAIGEELSKCQQ